MLTKEELLEKGLSEEVADEIISSFNDSSEESTPLSDLRKALEDEDSEMESLFKAEDEEDEEEEEKEEKGDAEYMKMKRYMKQKGAVACQKMMKELGFSKMNKAIEDFDTDADGAVVEMADLKPVLAEQAEINSVMAKAIDTLAGAIDVISGKMDKSFDLMQKAGRLQVKIGEGLSDFLSTPQGRKGVTAPQSQVMEKAISINKSQNELVYSTLMKAVQKGDKEAGIVISAFESHGHDANRLNAKQKEYINGLLTKEDK